MIPIYEVIGLIVISVLGILLWILYFKNMIITKYLIVLYKLILCIIIIYFNKLQDVLKVAFFTW